MNKITPGTYDANIIDYGFTETKAGNPQVAVKFEFVDKEGDRHEIIWFGSLTEKAAPHTIKKLLNCGLRGNDPTDIADGPQGGALDMQTAVAIVVEPEIRDDGKTYMKVNWINRKGAGIAQKLSKSDAKLKLGALNLKGAVMMAREETGIKDAPKQQSTTFNNSAPMNIAHPFTDADIPF